MEVKKAIYVGKTDDKNSHQQNIKNYNKILKEDGIMLDAEIYINTEFITAQEYPQDIKVIMISPTWLEGWLSKDIEERVGKMRHIIETFFPNVQICLPYNPETFKQAELAGINFITEIQDLCDPMHESKPPLGPISNEFQLKWNKKAMKDIDIEMEKLRCIHEEKIQTEKRKRKRNKTIKIIVAVVIITIAVISIFIF